MTSGTILRASLGLMFILSIAICRSQAGNLTVTKKVNCSITIDDYHVGDVVFGMFGQTAPKTVANFVAFAANNTPGHGYAGSMFHRIIKGFVVQGGDFVNGDGTGFISIYGEVFDDENFILPHLPGFVNMANKGPNTNGCQFSILTVQADWLNGKHCVFAKVIEGMNVVRKMENLPTNGIDHPIRSPIISSCKVIDVPVPYDVTPNLL
jgi:peptidyl-prolyl cis-trans isomerase B (cyclophilin B)